MASWLDLLSQTWPAKMGQAAWEAVKLPGDVYAGRAAVPSSANNGENIDRVTDLAGLVMTGTFGSAPSGAFGIGPVYRRSQKANTPDNGAGYMMFAENPHSISSYGKHMWELNPNALPTDAVIDAAAPEFRRAAYRALRSEYDRPTARSLVDEANPADIVNSAGAWDAPDVVSLLWDRVLDRKGWHTVTTKDGAVTFDPSLPRKIEPF